MDITVTPVADLRPDEKEELQALSHRVYPPGELRLGGDLQWAELDEVTDAVIRLREGGVLRSVAWVTRKTVGVDGQAIAVAGVRGVKTDPAARRRGYGRAVMLAAHELMQSFDECDVALLFSSELAVPFYEALGWRRVEAPVTCDQPEGRIVYTERLPPSAPVMALALRGGGGLPPGTVDVEGLPW